MLQAQCPDCSKVYDVSEELAGKAAKCRECGSRIPIPQLRADSAANRTKPAEPKPAPAKLATTTSSSSSSLKTAKDSSGTPTPTKPLSSKATTSPPAKSKPIAKPKPAAKKRSADDFFEDDFSDIEDYGEEDAVDEFDVEPMEIGPRKRRTSQKSRTKVRVNWNGIGSVVGRASEFVSDNVIGFSLTWLLIGWIGTSAMLACGLNQRAIGMLPGSISGSMLVAISILWFLRFAIGVKEFYGSGLDLLFSNWEKTWKPSFVFGIGSLFIYAGSIPGLDFLAGRDQQVPAAPMAVAPPPGINRQNIVDPNLVQPINAGPKVQAEPVNNENPAVSNGAELSPLPKLIPPNAATPAIVQQPNGRVVTFRVQKFAGQGDPVEAACEALGGVPWADLNDIEFDPKSGELRIGQLGGSVNTQQAKTPLENVGFQFGPGVSMGPKKK